MARASSAGIAQGAPNQPESVLLRNRDAIVFLSRPSAQLGHTLVAPTTHLTHVVDDFTSTAYLDLQGRIYRVDRALTRIVPTGMHYRMPRPGPQGQGVADAIVGQGRRAHFIQCDLASRTEVLRLVGECPAIFGPIDILLNNAMKMVVAPITEATLEDWEDVVNVNLRAAFMTIHYLLPSMLDRRRGVVVNMIAYEGSPLTAAYAATKVGSRSLVLTTAREIGAD